MVSLISLNVPEGRSARLLGDRLGIAVMEPGSLVLERKMQLGIKERAEGLAATAPSVR